MAISVNQAFYILQANAQTSSTIVQGPIFDQTIAESSCQALANKSPGVAYIVVMTMAGFSTDAPQALPITLTPTSGNQLLEVTVATQGLATTGLTVG